MAIRSIRAHLLPMAFIRMVLMAHRWLDEASSLERWGLWGALCDVRPTISV